MRRRPYHPDDRADAYLDAASVARVCAALSVEAAAPWDADALELIAEHEAVHRDVCLGVLDRERAIARVEALANGYREKHRDWVHNRSKVYWAFYRRLAELGVEPRRG
jgi:hypothetical protein